MTSLPRTDAVLSSATQKAISQASFEFGQKAEFKVS